MAVPYAIDSIGANPYFLNAYNSPNINYTAPQVSEPAVSDTTQVIPPAVQIETEKKDSKLAAKLIVGTALTAGAAVLCRKAYKTGTGAGTFEKICNGFKQWGNNLTNWGKGVKDKVITPEKFSVTQIGEETICTIPNRRNFIKNTEKLNSIGTSAEVPAFLDSAGKLANGIKIKNGTFIHNGQTFIVTNGRITGCEGMTKEAFQDFFTHPKTAENIDAKAKLQEVLTQFLKGETGTITKYSHSKDGISRLFEKSADGNFAMKCGISNRFNINSDAVNAYRYDNPLVDTALKRFKDNKTDGLKLASAEFSRNDLGTLYIKNGEISAIKWTDGNIYQKGSEKWKSLMQTNKDIYENIIKDQNCLQNKVYQMA